MKVRLGLHADSERQLDLLSSCIIRRVQSVAVQATEKQKKLEEEYRQATEKLKSDQQAMNQDCAKKIFRCTEKAKRELVELEQLRQKKELIICECRKACQRIMHTGALAEHDLGKKSQEEASARIEMLINRSQFEVSKYRNVFLALSFCTILSIVKDETARKALDRKNTLRLEFNMSEKRREKMQRNLNESLKRKSAFENEGRQSVARQKQLQSLSNDTETKNEQAKKVTNHAQKALQNELDAATNHEQVLQEDLNMSSERIKKLQRHILQVDKQEQWLDELESNCGTESRAYQLFQKTFAERNLFKVQLQEALQREEELFQQLQQMQENKKQSRKKLEIASESLKNTWEMIDRTWTECEQMVQTCTILSENEDMLQKHLEETELRFQGEVRRALSDEKKLQQKLRQLSEEEELSHTQPTKQKDSKSGELL